jgi:UDP-glucose 4-epimerase
VRVLVTGGTGYIGSHTVIELMQAGHEVLIVDNLSNSTIDALDAIAGIAGKKPDFVELNIEDTGTVKQLLREKHIEAVIHFAAYKAVGESVAEPLKYYRNNVGGIISLLSAVLDSGIRNFVFSSSAAVYGNPPVMLVTEQTPPAPESPYGWTKRMNEIILHDACAANDMLKGIALRYFNVVGAHESGKIGESPKGKPLNLLPIMIQTLVGKLPTLTVYGNDYPTPDGTCLRDYVHVVDLAKAHVAALDHIANDPNNGGYEVYNIGTGKPTSVMELIQAFEKVNGIPVPYNLGTRRPGDPAAYYASGEKARDELHWHATKTVEDAVRDAWRWQQYTASHQQ